MLGGLDYRSIAAHCMRALSNLTITFNGIIGRSVESTGNIAVSGQITPNQITGNQDDYSPADLSAAVVVRVSSNAAVNITGLNDPTAGRVTVFENVFNQPVTLVRESSSSAAANRFAMTANVPLLESDVAITLYDPTSARHRVIAQPPNGAYRSVLVSTANATWTKANYPGLKRVTATVVAGGGSGERENTNGGGGGGGGGTSIKTIEASALGATEAIVVGAGGAASAGAGNSGATSSFGAHCSASGGVGAGTVSSGSGGAGGAGSGGDINMAGHAGQNASTWNGGFRNGGGGGTFMGGGAPGNSGTPASGGAYGGGGAGSNGTNSGAGASGVVIVEHFF